MIGSLLAMQGEAGTSGEDGTTTEQSLSEIAVRAASGDPAALDALIESLDRSRTVHRMVGAMLLDRDAVDDVAQEVLISVMGSIGSYRGTGKVTSWLHPIVKRRVADHLRAQRESASLDEAALPPQRFSSMVASRAALRTALAQLPEKYQAPLILRDLEQLPVAEIAARLELPEGTVKAQISRGRAKLEKLLGALD
jgi:RNA polymerase sigma-70 factor (ECF subfamily)